MHMEGFSIKRLVGKVIYLSRIAYESIFMHNPFRSHVDFFTNIEIFEFFSQKRKYYYQIIHN